MRWLRDKGEAFQNGQGRTLYLTGACVDITERRAMEEDLRASEAQFRQLADAIPQIAWVTDAQGRVLVQAFTNLLANALDACPDPVHVTVSCREALLGGRPALQVAVRDNGPGFTPEQRRHVFEAFFTTKAKGTGLGLAIVRRAVEAHGGQVVIAESLASGAEVVLTLPRKSG